MLACFSGRGGIRTLVGPNQPETVFETEPPRLVSRYLDSVGEEAIGRP